MGEDATGSKVRDRVDAALSRRSMSAENRKKTLDRVVPFLGDDERVIDLFCAMVEHKGMNRVKFVEEAIAALRKLDIHPSKGNEFKELLSMSIADLGGLLGAAAVEGNVIGNRRNWHSDQVKAALEAKKAEANERTSKWALGAAWVAAVAAFLAFCVSPLKEHLSIAGASMVVAGLALLLGVAGLVFTRRS